VLLRAAAAGRPRGCALSAARVWQAEPERPPTHQRADGVLRVLRRADLAHNQDIQRRAQLARHLLFFCGGGAARADSQG
jgi:hypothetical protein